MRCRNGGCLSVLSCLFTNFSCLFTKFSCFFTIFKKKNNLLLFKHFGLQSTNSQTKNCLRYEQQEVGHTEAVNVYKSGIYLINLRFLSVWGKKWAFELAPPNSSQWFRGLYGTQQDVMNFNFYSSFAESKMDILPIPLSSLLVCLLVLTILDKSKPRTKKKKNSLSQRLRTLFIKKPKATIRKILPQ